MKPICIITFYIYAHLWHNILLRMHLAGNHIDITWWKMSLSSPVSGPCSGFCSFFLSVMSLWETRNSTTSPFSFLIGTMSRRHQNCVPEANTKAKLSPCSLYSTYRHIGNIYVQRLPAIPHSAVFALLSNALGPTEPRCLDAVCRVFEWQS